MCQQSYDMGEQTENWSREALMIALISRIASVCVSLSIERRKRLFFGISFHLSVNPLKSLEGTGRNNEQEQDIRRPTSLLRECFDALPQP